MEKNHLSDYSKFLKEFTEANYEVSELLSDDERKADQQYWSEPNRTKYENLLTKLEQWIIEARRHTKAAEHVTPKDGATTQQGESGAEDVDPDNEVHPLYTKNIVQSQHEVYAIDTQRHPKCYLMLRPCVHFVL